MTWIKCLPLLLFCACSVKPVPISREINVRVVSELSEADTNEIVSGAATYLLDAGVKATTNNDCVDCVHIGIKQKPLWRYLVGYQGWYSNGTILVYAGWSDSYNAKILAHEIAHALGCSHEIFGLMHQPWTSGWIIPGVDGLDFASGFSDSCRETMTNDT